jgi:hypothetical protein
MAARMMDSAERAGQRFSAGNMAWYAAKAARSGRRSYYTGRSDVMSPGCLMDGKARHEWLKNNPAPNKQAVVSPSGRSGRDACGCGAPVSSDRPRARP